MSGVDTWMYRHALPEKVLSYRERLEKARSYGEVWVIVKDSVRDVLNQYRVGMMLFLDDLPPQLGAFHPVGTNNIVMNRALLRVVESSAASRVTVNAFIYSILLHEYLHALGYLRESEVKPLVLKVSLECFGSDHIVSELASAGPWSVLGGIPLGSFSSPKRVIEIVKDFEEPSNRYIA
jgi:hypothetical protein